MECRHEPNGLCNCGEEELKETIEILKKQNEILGEALLKMPITSIHMVEQLATTAYYKAQELGEGIDL